MISTYKTLFLVACIALLASLSGCVTAQKVLGISPTTGLSVTNTVYSISPTVTNAQAVIEQSVPLAQGVLALTPAAPVAPFLPTAANGLMLLIAAASGAYAAYKNKQANVQTAAAASLAATVVSNAGTNVAAGVQTALTNAASNGSTAAVASHLASAQSPT